MRRLKRIERGQGVFVLSCLALLLALVARAHAAPPIREVRDIRMTRAGAVDLTPLHEWLKLPNGERPLKAWKELHVTEVKGVVAGLDECSVQIEGQVLAAVLIGNLPQPLKTAFTQSAQQQARIAALRSQIEAEEQQENYVAAARNGTFRRVRAALTRRVRATQEEIASQKKQLALLESDHEALLRKLTEQRIVLAMFTGRVHAKMQVWECGQSKG